MEDASAVPDPSNGFACLGYVDDEAAAGRVGTPADRAVLKYLVQHTWRKQPDDRRQSIGQVVLKYAAVKTIAQVTGLSRYGVQKTLRKLEQAGWLYVEAMTFENGQCAASLIMVKLDYQSHRDRQLSWQRGANSVGS